jgi:outer membrane protein assembly factor BamB
VRRLDSAGDSGRTESDFDRLKCRTRELVDHPRSRKLLLVFAIWLWGGLLLSHLVLPSTLLRAENWPRWRGPDGSGVSSEKQIPWQWSNSSRIGWQYEFPGEGASSPIVWQDRVFLTSAENHGVKRHLICLDRLTGELQWQQTVTDENPELTSALTGHAAATPVTDGKVVIAFFGNAGLVACDMAGMVLWRKELGPFDTELGMSSSPILFGDLVLQVCDHDGDRRRTFDSFVVALDRRTGDERWRSQRRGLFRSWSTPVVIPGEDGPLLVVNGQDALRAYDIASGVERWNWEGMTGWVTPSPIYDGRFLLATSGRDGPIVLLRPEKIGTGAEEAVKWQHPRGGPYVCSPLLNDGRLYVHDERGILRCYDGLSGELLYRERLAGRFYASAVAADGRIYVSNDSGVTYVLRCAPSFEVLAENDLEEEILASPAISGRTLWIRTRTRLVCIRDD